MLIGSTLQTAYSFVNAIWVGKFLGKTALAAVTVSFPIIFVLMALAGGLTLAANILISQYVGAREWPQVKKVVQTSTGLIILLSLVLTAVGELFTAPMLRAMGTPADVLPVAIVYMRIILATLPLNFGLFLISSMLRGVGDSTTPLYFQAIFLVITAVLDPVLMFGLVGMPRLGLNGTAVATVITQFGALASACIYLHRKGSIVSPDWRRLHIDWNMGWILTKIGFPSAIQQALVSVGMVVVIGCINAFGENATAAFGAAMRIDQIAFMPAMTVGMAISTVVGQNVGAQKHHRVPEAFWWGILIGGGITLLVSAVTLTFPGALLSMFINTQRDPGVLPIGVGYLRIVGAFYTVFAIFFVSNGVINGSGQTLITTIISLIGLWILRVPLAYLLPKYLTHDVTGIWYAMGISSTVGMLISVTYYASGRWKRTVVQHRPPSVINDEERAEELQPS